MREHEDAFSFLREMWCSRKKPSREKVLAFVNECKTEREKLVNSKEYIDKMNELSWWQFFIWKTEQVS